MSSQFDDLSSDEILALGILHSFNGDDLRAVQHLEPLADAGNQEAQTRLGWELISGNRTQEERTVGLAYLKSAASSGSLWARYFLASDKIAIREGKKVSEDQFEEGLSEFRELAELCKFAAERNDPRAEFILAECYQYGYGVSRDVSEARRYYSRAWIHGDQMGLSAMHLTLLYSLEANRSPEMKELHQLWRERARWEGIDRIAADW